MDKKYRLNCRMNVNIIITNFWVTIAKLAKDVQYFAKVRAERRVKRNMYLADQMRKEDYPKSFETQLVSISREFGHH